MAGTWLTVAFLTAKALLAQSPAFEAASVKPSDPNLGERMFPVRGGPGSNDPDRVVYSNMSLRAMLYYAYGKAGSEIAGPTWLGTPKFDIEAKAPPGTSKDQFTLMLRNLLAERFHLVVHRESKEVQGYDLVVGKNGSKLKPASEEDVIAAGQPPVGPGITPGTDAKGYMRLARPGMIYPSVPGSNGHAIHLIARAQLLSDLCRFLGGMFQHPILNKTGLDGRYDFTLEFALETTAPTDVAEDVAPRIPVALEDQLGLKLDPTKVSVETLVVDSADKVPTGN